MEFIPAKTIVTKTKSDAWFGIDYNMNIYKGCNHGCIYCDSRSECYRIDNFDRVRAKDNTIALIEKELKRKRKTGIIGTGSMSDPYNPFEKNYKLTRKALELINAHGFGISVATKSDLIVRDIDILKKIANNSPVIIKITITTADDGLCKMIEPNVAVSSKRFEVIKQLSDNNIFTGILMMPVLPFIEDNKENIKDIIHLAYQNGAKFIYPAFGMTLRGNQRAWYYKKLDENFPSIKQKYIRKYGDYYECRSENSKLLSEIFSSECRKLGILYQMKDIIKEYKSKYNNQQLTLFD